MFDIRKLDKWLDLQFTEVREDDPITSISLIHIGQNGRSVIDDSQYIKEDFEREKLLKRFQEAAENVCDSIPGMAQTFGILINFQIRNAVMFRFRHYSMADSEDGFGASEPATSSGLQAQLMRHLEARDRNLQGMFQATVGMMQQTIGRLTGMVEESFESRIRMAELNEELLSRKAERDLQVSRELRKDKLISDGVDKVSQLLPMVVWKLTGKNILGAKRTPTEMLIDDFIEHVDEEQFQALVRGEGVVFSDLQKQNLFTLFLDAKKRLDAKKKDEEKKMKELKGGEETPQLKSSNDREL